MIIRKPYAFLIRHFRKIHIFMLALGIFAYYKNVKLLSFINEFITYNSYIPEVEPVTLHISMLVLLSLLLLIVGNVALIFLLKHKNKPWKMYLMPVIIYTATLVTYFLIRGYFLGYDGDGGTTAVRTFRDLVVISAIAQVPIFILNLVRIFGLDLNKFNFKTDDEFLEMEEADREELEINIKFDFYSIKRFYKRTIRNMGYFYEEHKKICIFIIVLIVLYIGNQTYHYLFIQNKSYKEGDTYNIGRYTFKVNKSYYTDKDYKGDQINQKTNFIIVDLTATNNMDPIEMNLSRFHIINRTNQYPYSGMTYETEFHDLGKVYQVKELKRGESVRCLLIFKVDKNLPINNFVLYYQELGGNNYHHLRKIKLKISDLSKIKKEGEYRLEDSFTFKIGNEEEETISFDDYAIEDSFDYTYKNCEGYNCGTHHGEVEAGEGNKILKVNFASNAYEGKELIDFCTSYGKIIYKDNNGKNKYIAMKKAINRNYYGKYLYLKIPNEVAESDNLTFQFIIRNKKYIYRIK